MKITVPEGGKFYGTKKDRNIYVTGTVLLALDIVSIYTLINLTISRTFEWFTLITAFAAFFISYFIWRAFVIGASAVVTEKTIIGYNAFDRRIGEIALEDVEEIYIMWKNTYDVVLKTKDGKKLLISAGLQPADELFNTILQKAINCNRVSIEKAKDFAPNLVYYKK